MSGPRLRPKGQLASDASKLSDDLAVKPRLSPDKTLPDPEPRPRGRIPDAEPVPATTSVPKLRSGAVRFRAFLDRSGFEETLRTANATLPTGAAERIFATVESTLAGRRLAALGAEELAELRDTIRRTCVRAATGTALVQRQLMAAARSMQLMGFTMSDMSVRSGTWLYFHSRAGADTVIDGVSFVPNRKGTPVPAVIPDPALAGVGGRATWRHADGTIRAVPPPIPTRPAVAASGLGPEALERVPDLVLKEVRRAEKTAENAAARYDEATARPLRARGVSPQVGARTGVGVFRIHRRLPTGPGRAWDDAIEVSGVTGPTSRIRRLDEKVMDAALPRPSDLGPKFAGFARCHVWGPVLGDETLAGLAYAHHKAVNLVQRFTVEEALRWSPGRSFRGNVRAATPVRITAYRQLVTVGERTYPFLRTVHYDITLEDGRIVRAFLDITDDGQVTKGASLLGGGR
jgi:hypothetical protein